MLSRLYTTHRRLTLANLQVASTHPFKFNIHLRHQLSSPCRDITVHVRNFCDPTYRGLSVLVKRKSVAPR